MEPRETPLAAPFPVVALGASAGGLEALRRLFARIPPDSGLAFVVIQHLDPERPSMLSHVIERVTKLSVVEACNGMPLEANRVHVIPADADLTILRGIVALVPREKTGRLHLPIDTFFRSLAEDRGAAAIGVVLSGSGADGREGLRAIKSEGGIAIAQRPESAQFRSMPESAIAAGVVDFRGTPEEIADELLRLGRHPYLSVPDPGDQPSRVKGESGDLAPVFTLLRQQAGVDFTGYKRTTLIRRIERRMALRRVSTLEAYAEVLREDRTEGSLLAADLLIHVTSFFRDPDAFVALKEHAFAPLVKRKADGDAIRIWVPGCSTGEEVYSLTICLLETIEEAGRGCAVKVFGSDLSEDAIQTARRGVYAESAVVDTVSPARLTRFFESFDPEYRIGKQVRDVCVFARHDLTSDPPFARLDLISCRNVLIYFDGDLQRRIIPTLHHCLNEQGYVFLGQSETINSFRDLFAPVDKEHRLFVKTGESPQLAYPAAKQRGADAQIADRIGTEPARPAREAQRQADHLLLARYAPPAVIVNERLEIVEYRGHTGRYLEAPPGQPQANVLRMAREGLAAPLHDAFERARAQAGTVRKEGLRVQVGSETRELALEVVPLSGIERRTGLYFLVLFEDAGQSVHRLEAARSQPLQPSDDAAAQETLRLRSELASTKDYVQSLVAEHQMAIDELAAANEELIAANEELQSTNEELQSAKEELQSTNEELATVNDQLESRNKDLDRIANDLANVLTSVEIPLIIVDLDLRVRRFTPSVRRLARFIPADVGRPLDDLKLKIQIDDLPGRIRGVIGDLAVKDWEVQAADGHWFRMTIRPYRTSDNRLDGAVLSFLDVDEIKRALDAAEAARDYAKSIVETVAVALVVVDAASTVVSANDAFYTRLRTSAKTAVGKRLAEVATGLWERPPLREAIQSLLGSSTPFANLEFSMKATGNDDAVCLLGGRPILWDSGERLFLLAIEDVTALRVLEAERGRLLESEKQARREAERANRTKDLFLATLSHELRTPLAALTMSAHLLNQAAASDPNIQRIGASIDRSVRSQARLIDDLLDVSRIVSGKLLLDMAPVDLRATVQDAVDAARPAISAKGLRLESAVEGEIGSVYGDAGRLQQIVNNLLTNAIKFTPQGGQITVRLEAVGARASLTVTDTGIGIRPEVLPDLFDRFVQADASITRTYGGLGLGLSIVRYLVEVHGGTVEAESRGEGQGATFRVMLPMGSAEPVSHRSREASGGIAGVRVLVVEDDEDTREGYATVLGAFGAIVHAESSSGAALAALHEFQPDVILCDMAMPGEDGCEFITRLRSAERSEHGSRWIPAAAVTALASPEARKRALEAGFQMHVRKPIDAQQIAATVRRLADWIPPTSPVAPQ